MESEGRVGVLRNEGSKIVQTVSVRSSSNFYGAKNVQVDFAPTEIKERIKLHKISNLILYRQNPWSMYKLAVSFALQPLHCGLVAIVCPEAAMKKWWSPLSLDRAGKLN